MNNDLPHQQYSLFSTQRFGVKRDFVPTRKIVFLVHLAQKNIVANGRVTMGSFAKPMH